MRLDRDLHQLEGILRGITLDGTINPQEIAALTHWCNEHQSAATRHPFDALIPVIRSAAADGVIEFEERQDIEWLLARARTPNAYFNVATSDMQRLHGQLAGIAFDDLVNEREANGLSDWLRAVYHLKGSWPYDAIVSLLERVLTDGKIDEQEHRAVLGFCQNFIGHVAHLVTRTSFDEDFVRNGVCDPTPIILFDSRSFCLTGASRLSNRDHIHILITQLGGTAQPRVTKSLDYLVVCNEGNKAWAFSSYGRKVESAMQMNADGARIAIIEENDFWDAVEETGQPRPEARRQL